MQYKYDLSSPTFFADPYPTYSRMREEDPVYFAPDHGMWFVTRYRDVYELAADPKLSSERVDGFFVSVRPGMEDKVAVVHRFFSDFITFMDSTRHSRVRSLLAKAFTTRRVEQLREFTQRVVDERLEQLGPLDQIDIVADLGDVIPATVICHMLGVAADDFEDFKRWTADLIPVAAFAGDPNDNVQLAFDAISSLKSYFRVLIEDRRRTRTDDVLGALVAAEEDGHALSEDELFASCAMLLLAGLETTSNMIGNAMYALMDFPDQLELLRTNPDLIGPAVEEILRYFSAAPALPRLVTEDTVIGGQQIPAGQYVIGIINSANRDSAVFPDPDVLDIQRPENPHIAFGRGRHVCLGAPLARMELQITLASLLRRYGSIERIGRDASWVQGFAHRGVLSLPVKVEV